ncbi:hypothetical protein [Calycomorphotria hydatis]|uniref:Uncharacterized protein n=1 Tax=Calycomorphotria hydatis TaxID=2528027 RepID=A0A517TBX1_9PLAN|nr:hypothetical protein [Calycomorphotria hydatis]QDT65860.1 hypothetical protein V22_31220 [Calycomorphotria hydatis]
MRSGSNVSHKWWKTYWFVCLFLVVILLIAALPLFMTARGSASATVTFLIRSAVEFPQKYTEPISASIVELSSGDALATELIEDYSCDITCSVSGDFVHGPLVQRLTFNPYKYGVQLNFESTSVTLPLEQLLDRKDFDLNEEQKVLVIVPAVWLERDS